MSGAKGFEEPPCEPTAQTSVADVEETPLNTARVPIDGVDVSVQAEPSQCSATGSWSVAPTAHTSSGASATTEFSVAAATGRFDVCHADPSQCAASGPEPTLPTAHTSSLVIAAMETSEPDGGGMTRCQPGVHEEAAPAAGACPVCRSAARTSTA